jgi:hypothetical protein
MDQRFGDQYAQYMKTQWKRYLDDCFIFWSKTDEELNDLHNMLNNLHPYIKFTMEKSATELPFLDILIIKQGLENYNRPVPQKDGLSSIYFV